MNEPVASPRRARLAKQIVQLALRHEWEPGHHVTELELVGALDVSRSPVRSALQYLHTLGALSFKRNQGFFVEMNNRQLSRLQLDPSHSVEDGLYLRIVDDRVAGNLTEYFTRTELAERYNVGRLNLSKTLGRMEDEGLVARNPGQGWRFLPTLGTLQSQQSSYEFRMAIEPAAILASSFKADAAELARLRSAHSDLKAAIDRNTAADEWVYQTDADFHETLARLSGNQYFVNAVVQHNRLRRLFEIQKARDFDRVGEWCAEHLAVITALDAGKTELAAKRMVRHLKAANKT